MHAILRGVKKKGILESYSFHTFLLGEGDKLIVLVFYLNNYCVAMSEECNFDAEN